MGCVVLAVKAADAEAAALQARPLLAPETVVLTIQNGFGSPPGSAATGSPSGWRAVSAHP